MRVTLPTDYRLYPNVRWIHKEHRDAPARDGETDLVIVHSDMGLLVVETKGGRSRRDGQGRWWSSSNRLDPAPFKQAETSEHALIRKLTELPRFGAQVLWNGSYDDAGHHLGTSADDAPNQPLETILFQSIRRFKGLEREVVVIVEVDQDVPRLDHLLYVGATRAREHLVVMGVRSAERDWPRDHDTRETPLDRGAGQARARRP